MTARGPCVYFIRDKRDGFIKIGTAKNPVQRLRELQCGSAVELELLHTVPGGRDLEKAYHMVLGPFRVRGEWFEPNPVVALLAAHPQHGKWRHSRHRGPWAWLRHMNDQFLYESLGLSEDDLYEEPAATQT